MKSFIKFVGEIQAYIDKPICRSKLYRKVRIDSRIGNNFIEVCLWLGIVIEIKKRKRIYVKRFI